MPVSADWLLPSRQTGPPAKCGTASDGSRAPSLERLHLHQRRTAPTLRRRCPAAFMTPSSRTAPTFAGCRIEAELGRGGMGVVYRATQLRLERPVALKVMASELARDERFRQRFERESRLAASIDHPHVIPIYEANEEGGRLYLVMRYVPGPDLGQLIASEGRLGPARAARLTAQVGSALDAAHQSALVHRDIKPVARPLRTASRHPSSSTSSVKPST